ncbi:MAG: response regulator, partial [Rhodospirillum sp.]|nr:response regulator [Rhodospirillum sp.]
MTETPATAPGSASLPDGILCEQPADLQSPQARQILRRILEPFLSEQAAVPMELLHSPPLLAQLSVDDRLPDWKNKIARLQADGQDAKAVDMRQRIMDALLHFLMEQVDAAASNLPNLPMDGKTFAMLSKKFGPTPDERERTLLGVLVARAAERHGTEFGKAEAVLDMVAHQDDVNNALFLDPFLADFLRIPHVTRTFLGNPPSRMETLRDLASLIKGQEVIASGRSPLALRLDFLVREMKLPQCQEALTFCLLTQLSDPDPFVALPDPEGEMSARDVFDELLAIGELAKTLKGPKGLVGGGRAVKLLDDRIMALITGDRLAQLMEDKGTIDRLRTLFRFQKMGLAAQSRRALGEHIVDAIEDRDFAGRIRDEIPKSDEQMTSLGELSELVSQAALGDATRQRLTETLDGVQYDLIRTNHLFTELRKDKLRDIRAYMRVLNLAAEGAFVPGRCGTEAKDLLSRFARHPDFLRNCLAHLQGAGDTGGSMEELTRKLRA